MRLEKVCTDSSFQTPLGRTFPTWQGHEPLEQLSEDHELYQNLCKSKSFSHVLVFILFYNEGILTKPRREKKRPA